jgi:hypothetical protein
VPDPSVFKGPGFDFFCLTLSVAKSKIRSNSNHNVIISTCSQLQ